MYTRRVSTSEPLNALQGEPATCLFCQAPAWSQERRMKNTLKETRTKLREPGLSSEDKKKEKKCTED